MFDFDHINKEDKLGDILLLPMDQWEEEIKGTHLLCCFCHKRKSWIELDYVGCRLLPINSETMMTEEDDADNDEEYEEYGDYDIDEFVN